MKAVCLKIYVHQFQKHHNMLVWEWLLQKAKGMGFSGGTAFLSLASFGHRGHLHESHFYELGGGNLSVEVTLILTEEQVTQTLNFLKDENLNLYYIKYPVESGFVIGS